MVVPDGSPLRCLVVDDDPLACLILANCIARTPFLDLIGSCQDAYTALTELNTQPVDLLFLDLAMPGLSGPDLLRAVHSPPPTVFTTSAVGPLPNTFRVSVLAYLRKPVTYALFQEAAELVRTALLLQQTLPAEGIPKGD